MSQFAVTLDTEVFPNCFLLVARICDTEITVVFEISQFKNESVELLSFLHWLRDNKARAYGFNIVNFDVADLESAVKKTAIVVSLAIAAQKVVTTGCKIAEIYASK